MRKTLIFLGLILLPIISLFTEGCSSSNNVTPQYPTYSYIDPIINPPDEFDILYNMSLMGDQSAYVTFDSNAVWKVEKLGDSRIGFAVSNDTIVRIISSVDTIGFKGGFIYTFVANNNNYPDFNNFFTHFTKLSIDYNGFKPKL